MAGLVDITTRGNVRFNVTLRHVRVTTVALKKKQ
jgi:hypothetical protein